VKFNKVKMHSLTYHLHEQVLTSSEIENQLSKTYERLNMSSGRLEMMTGIKERRFWDKGTSPGLMASVAGRSALEKADISPKDVDLLIFSSVCRDFLEPATASIVHHELGLPSTCSFVDLSNACLGVLNAMIMAANMIESGAIKCALIVSGENSGPLLAETLDFVKNNPDIKRKEIKKIFANFTIGSAAVGLILTSKDFYPWGLTLLGGATLSDSTAHTLCQGSGNVNSLMMQTDSEKLMKAGIKLATDTWEKTKEVLDWNNNSPDWVVGHQVGKSHEAALLESLNLNHKNTYTTFEKFGNTGSAALPLTLAKLMETNKMSSGQNLAMLGIGSGLSSIMLGATC
jgi:3-oxoacyl-[acyl-carrier-protein] synthase-3